MAQAFSCRPPTAEIRVVGVVVGKVAMGQVFPEHFGFPLAIPFHRCPITWKRTKIIIIFVFIFICVIRLLEKP
jgi:hypothetical protein